MGDNFVQPHSEYCQGKSERPFVQKRLFISYGHDEHITLAQRLYEDLENRGHNVWFDIDRLSPGYDWEIFIENGLQHLAADKKNAVLLLLLTPRSVRRPDGYCLNEVTRALSRGLRIVPIMVVESEPPLSICRIQWLDMRECIPIQEKEAFYKPRFYQLIRAIEEDLLDFEGSQQRLLKTLQPMEFDADILHHLSKFIGRTWVLTAIENWLKQDEGAGAPINRVFWMSGGPGTGKTALCAVLCSQYLEVAAMHLCKFGHVQKSDPRRVVMSIIYQLSTQLPEYESRLATIDVETYAKDDARTMFDNLLLQPLAKLNRPNHIIIILIDALDEATHGGRNELASFIASEFPKTPEWLRMIVTSRPEKEVIAPLQGLNPFILDTEVEANKADILEYLNRELSALLKNRMDKDQVVELILTRSEGVFLYVERVCHDIQCNNLSIDHLDRLPQGLGGVYWQFFERQFPDLYRYKKDIRPALRAILAASEPLPLLILQGLFGWNEEEINDFTLTLGSLFKVTDENGIKSIKPFHKSIADWMVDSEKAGTYFTSISEGQQLLANYGWSEFSYNLQKMSQYMQRYLPFHLIQTERFPDFCKLVTSIQYNDLIRKRGEITELLTFCDEQLNSSHLFTQEQKENLKIWLVSIPEERIGEFLHEKFRLERLKAYRTESSNPDTKELIKPWSNLNQKYRARHRRATAEILNYLEKIGIGIRLASDKVKEIYFFTNLEIEWLAEAEHNRWLREMKSIGWTYGPIKNYKELQTPYLVPWSEYTEDVKQYDKYFIRNLPQVFAIGGYELYRK